MQKAVQLCTIPMNKIAFLNFTLKSRVNSRTSDIDEDEISREDATTSDSDLESEDLNEDEIPPII